MPTTYRIHPAIGIARLGNSPDEFCISPEEPAALPLDCDERGNPLPSPDGGTELRIRAFKDAHGRIKRQAARFQVYVYDDESPEGRPLSLGDPVAGGGNHGTLVDVQWRVYLANKKASWYEFRQLEGEHGYAPGHPRRNATVTDPEARQRLIIDPGPRIVDATTVRTARFDRDGWDVYAPTFPPPLVPHSIDTLGELRTDDSGRLLVLGGHGHSGSWRADEFGEPRIDDYANNDGWYDDTSDGPVMARLVMYSEQVGSTRFIDVEYPAWVLVGYPAYVPEMLDMITLDEVLEDLSIREFATRPDLYGEAGTWDHPRPVDRRDPGALAVWRAGRLQWNPAYRPWFYRDVWPILFRPDQFSYTSSILGQSNFPHNQSKRGNFDPVRLGAPPTLDAERLRKCEQGRVKDHHSGELFVSSFHPALMVLEREARAALGELAGEGVPGVPADLRVFGGRLAQRLREAVAAFTRAVYPGHPAEVEPYLAGWRTLGQPEAAGPPPVGSGPGTGSAPEHQGQGRRLAVAEARAEAVPLENAPPEGEAPPAAAEEPGAPAGDYAGARRELEAAVLAALADAVPDEAGTAEAVGRVLRLLGRQLRGAALEHLRAFHTGRLLEEARRRCVEANTFDPYRDYRQYVFDLLRAPGEENRFGAGGKPDSRTRNLPLMPLLAGDNPLNNTLPSKFLRLTDYQYYILRQWATGLFHNERLEGWASPDPWNPYAGWVNRTGHHLDRGVLSNLLGGAFCPGGEVSWIIRNPALFHEPYRIRADPDFYAFRQTAAQANAWRGSVPESEYAAYVSTALGQDTDFARGMQPGDLTKYSGLPWQADFNECSTQNIDVTYDEWNEIYPASGENAWMAREQRVWQTLWWPAHRPLQTNELVGMVNGQPSYQWLPWSPGVPQTNAGDLKMVTEWWRLGFVRKNPFMGTQDVEPTEVPPPNTPPYVTVERTPRSGKEEV